MACLREGRVQAGIEAFRALLAVDGRSATAWYNLGYLLRCDRQFDGALAAYERALVHGIDRAEEIRLNRAVILSEFLNRDEEAEAELQAALAINPRFIAAWLNLGNVLEDRGAANRASEAYRRVLALDPYNARSLARLSAIAIHQGRAAEVPAHLRTLLASARLPSSMAAEIGFALGNALDALGEYDHAFAAYTAANKAAAQAIPPAARYDRRAQAALIDRLIALPPCTDSPEAEPGPTPIFICGMFRSGSTLVEGVLSRHSQLTAGGELEIVPAMVARSLQPYPESLNRLPASAFAELAGRYLGEVRPALWKDGWFTDKRPDNFLHIGLIKRLFPAAKFLHTTRDPIDNALSIYFLYFDDSISYGNDLDDIAHWMNQYRRLMDHWRECYGDDILDVSYDALVARPDASVTSMLEFVGLPWEPDLTRARDEGRSVKTASVWQVRQPIHQRSSGRWQHYAKHLSALREALEPR